MSIEHKEFDKLITHAVEFGDMMRWFFNHSGCNGLVDNMGLFTKVSALFAEILGYTQEEMTNSPFVLFLHPDDVEKTLDVYNNRFFQGVNASFTNRYKHKDGHYVAIRWSLNFGQIGDQYLFTGHPIIEE